MVDLIEGGVFLLFCSIDQSMMIYRKIFAIGLFFYAGEDKVGKIAPFLGNFIFQTLVLKK